MILASVFLGETVRPIAIVAAALILAGVYLAGRPAPPAARPEAVPGNPD
jgi:drug/metabolite transporter (DMT)-like permease